MRRVAALVGLLVLAACDREETRVVQPKLFPLQETQDFGTLPVLNVKQIDIARRTSDGDRSP